MRKVSLFAIFTIFTLFLIPLGTSFLSQPISYISVEEGEKYEWKVNLDINGLDKFMNNIEALLSEIQTKISELNLSGYESLSIPETMETFAHEILSNLLPSGWDALNVSALLHNTIEYYVTEFNSTCLAGKVPSNWKSLDYDAFLDFIIDGLNTTMPSGWEEKPVPKLIKLVINEFNNSLLFGLLPEGWEDFTLKEIFNDIIQETIPELRNSFITYMMITQMIEMMLSNFPSEVIDYSIDELLPIVLPSNVTDLNLTSLCETIKYFINSTMYPGWESDNITTLINYQVDVITANLPSGYDEVNFSTIIVWGINEIIENATNSVPSGSLPFGWENMTISDLTIAFIEEGKAQWTDVVLPQWNVFKQSSEFLEIFPDTIGLRLTIYQIGSEVEAYEGGPKATPLDITAYVSLDMENWIGLEELFSNLTGPVNTAESESIYYEENYTYTSPFEFLLNFSYTPYIVDPSTYSDGQLALLDQLVFTGGFIIANNYEWENSTFETAIEIQGNPDAFEFSTEWNEYGLLQQAYIKADGITAVSITLSDKMTEIPGYEMITFIIIVPIAITGLIFYIRKKKY